MRISFWLKLKYDNRTSKGKGAKGVNSRAMINSIKKVFDLFKKTFCTVLLFEILYRAVSSLIFKPLLSSISRGMLQLGGHSLAFNEQIVEAFLNIPGLLALILLAVLAAILIYLEFSVMILTVYYQLKNQPIRLTQAMKISLLTLESLKNLGIVGFSFYAIVLLPFINIGFDSSLLPALRVPNFVSEELMKTTMGSLLFLGLLIIIAIVYLSTMFTLPMMVLKQQSFIHSFKESLFVFDKLDRKRILMLALFCVSWFVLFVNPGWIKTYYSGISDASVLRVLFRLMTSFRMIRALFGYLFGQLALIAMMLIFVILLTESLVWLGQTFEINDEALPHLDITIKKGRRVVFNMLDLMFTLIRVILTRIRRSPFYRKHRKLLLGILVVSFLMQLSYWLRPSIAVHDPIVVGHRGSLEGVENTLEAIQGAVEAKADYAEIDILLSKDGIPMVIHDTHLQRLANKNVSVYELTAKELQALSLTQNDAVGKISTLEEVIEFCRGKIDLLIELKLHGKETESVVHKMVEVVEKQGYVDHCLFMSLNYSLVSELKALRPDYPVGYCVYGNVGKLTAATLRQLNVDFLTVEESMVSRRFVQRCQEADLPVYVWTVNDPFSMQEYLNKEVSGIITDYPADAIEVVKKFRFGWTARQHYGLDGYDPEYEELSFAY